MTNGSRMARVLAALAVTAAMGFGGAQAFASPAAAAADELACTLKQCTADCLAIGYNVGRCEQGTCVCYWTAPDGD
jgi:glutamate/tyrosine decarboxylase-like PLP-dependent enzyme